MKFMDNSPDILVLKFCGDEQNRHKFLHSVRLPVMEFVSERMTLDALINEIVKSIYDHAHGIGELRLERKLDGSIEFMIKDSGYKTFEFEQCIGRSTLVGNGRNFGIGLAMIQSLARTLKIDLKIDTSQGFNYSGVYRKR